MQLMTEGQAVYAIADTHLGLREWRGQTHSDEPVVVGEFLRWLQTLPEKGGEEVSVREAGGFIKRRLRPVTSLVLLGDILELYDAENQAVLLSSVPFVPILEQLACEKVYVLGNHDNILESLTGQYPLGVQGLSVVRNVYPIPDEDTGVVRPLKIGSEEYLFVHGHQFDPLFTLTGRMSRILGVLRQFGAALGNWAWLIFALWLATVIAQCAFGSPLWGWLVVSILALLWIPRICMKSSRVFWNRFFARRYKRQRALRGFHAWWGRFHRSVPEADDLGIVYGHTHMTDWFVAGSQAESQSEAVDTERRLGSFLRGLRTRRHTLYNISSWISTKGKHKDVIRATIFYADEQGPLLLGWDWEDKCPFHIPFEFVRKRRLGQILDSAEVEITEQLGWPLALIRKWQRPWRDLT